MPPVRPLPVALVGQKFMGKAHANAWSQAARFFCDLRLRPVLHTACGRDATSLAAFAERWGFRKTTTRWRTIAGDDEVRLVDVCVPNHLHAEIALAMLEADKHVACEKPLAATLAEARAMRDAARRSKGRTFVWFNYRRCPAVGLMRRLVREGRLGRVLHVRASYLQSWGGPDTPSSWRFRRRSAGSGALGDLAAHVVDLARFVTGDEIVEIPGAVLQTYVKERRDPTSRRRVRSDVDDCAFFLARFQGGAVGRFEATRLAPGHLNRNTLEVNGEKGSLAFDFEDMNVLRYCDTGADPALRGFTRIVCTDARSHPWVAAYWPEGHGLGYEHGFVGMAADVCRVLQGGRPEAPLPDFADAYETQRVLAAAQLAARERRAVRLREVR